MIQRNGNGERSKILIQAILKKLDLLMLDEHLSGLDSEAQDVLIKMIHKLKNLTDSRPIGFVFEIVPSFK